MQASVVVIRASIFLAYITVLSACGEDHQKLNAAIEASRKGVALLEQNETQQGRKLLLEAEDHYADLISREPGNPLYANNYGWVLMKLEKYKESEKLLKMAKRKKEEIEPSYAPSHNLSELKKVRHDE